MVGQSLEPEAGSIVLVEEVAKGKEKIVEMVVEAGADGVVEDGVGPLLGNGRCQHRFAHAAAAADGDGMPLLKLRQRLGNKRLTADEGVGEAWGFEAKGGLGMAKKLLAYVVDDLFDVGKEAGFAGGGEVEDVVDPGQWLLARGEVAAQVVEFKQEVAVAGAFGGTEFVALGKGGGGKLVAVGGQGAVPEGGGGGVDEGLEAATTGNGRCFIT